MNITFKQVTVRELVNGYEDNSEMGVVAFDGKLNVRPPYQREFVYGEKQQVEVINTVRNNFPLNVMYWVKNSDDTYELLDGQQRTLSICHFVIDNSVVIKKDGKYDVSYDNLTATEKEQILNYQLMVYVCEGTDEEKLAWFHIVNIAGEVLTNQELRNAVYTGKWLASAKKYFSKTGCPAYQMANKYIKGSPIRQEYLETVLSWIANKEGKTIEKYMSEHQHDDDASDLWIYFQKVINWVKAKFPKYYKEMLGIDWGRLYNTYGDNKYDVAKLEERIEELMGDFDVTKKSGIFEFVLSSEDPTKRRLLNVRAFDDRTKKAVFKEQKGICPLCKGTFKYEEMEGDHITPWWEGGHTIKENCQMLCKNCNRTKSGK